LSNVADALVSEVDENNVGGHRILWESTKQKSRSTLRQTAKATGLDHLFNLKPRSLSKLERLLTVMSMKN
jgi:hypothetical protein